MTTLPPEWANGGRPRLAWGPDPTLEAEDPTRCGRRGIAGQGSKFSIRLPVLFGGNDAVS